MKSLSNIESTALRSEFLALGEEAEFEEQDEYFVVRSPQNPLFYWGNFLIFKQSPEMADIPRWEKIFCEKFSDFIYQHRAFAWIYGNISEDFQVNGYSLERSVCLITNTVRKVSQINPKVTVRKIKPNEWSEIEKREIALGQSENDSDPSFASFIKLRIKEYQRLLELQKGDCFIAQLDGQSVGHLMLFHGEKMACFQDVVTYPDFQGNGVCHALVYSASLYALQYYDIDKLIIIAEKHSLAQKIYQNLGFEVVEEITRLYKSTL